MNERFDDLARSMAGRHSRRGALKMMAGAAGAAVAATVLKPFRAHAAPCPGGSPCGSGCCGKGEACSDPASACCCPGGTSPCGNHCCKAGTACVDRSGGICGCPAGTTSCGSGANLICCAAGKACGDASCKPKSTYPSTVAKNCGPTCAPTVLFKDDFLGDSPANCQTALVNWNIPPGGDVDVAASWPGSSGQVVDLDGSPNLCGGDGVPPISLKTPITVLAGRTYTASFKISTNPSPFLPGGAQLRPAGNPDVNTVSVNFGPANATYTKQPSQSNAFTTEFLSFVAGANGTAQLVFQMVGPSDRGGVILDRVDVTESCP